MQQRQGASTALQEEVDVRVRAVRTLRDVARSNAILETQLRQVMQQCTDAVAALDDRVATGTPCRVLAPRKNVCIVILARWER